MNSCLFEELLVSPEWVWHTWNKKSVPDYTGRISIYSKKYRSEMIQAIWTPSTSQRILWDQWGVWENTTRSDCHTESFLTTIANILVNFFGTGCFYVTSLSTKVSLTERSKKSFWGIKSEGGCGVKFQEVYSTERYLHIGEEVFACRERPLVGEKSGPTFKVGRVSPKTSSKVPRPREWFLH